MIKGIQKVTLIDYPGHIACTVFLGGCNLRCGYCYNKDLVLNTRNTPNISEETLLLFLSKRRKYLDGVCITGGEPTLYPKIVELCEKIKKLGYLIKLDTNGTNPSVVEELIKKKLIDYIAMDVKASKDKYPLVTGVSCDVSIIGKSIKQIMNAGIKYEFRTTAVPGQYDKDEAEQIGQWIEGSEQYFIQQFRPTETTINPKFSSLQQFSIEQLEKFKGIMEKYARKVEIRGT